MIILKYSEKIFEVEIVSRGGRKTACISDTTGSSSSTDYEFVYGSYLKMLEINLGSRSGISPRYFPILLINKSRESQIDYTCVTKWM